MSTTLPTFDRTRRIKNPWWASVKKFLDNRLVELEANGPADELALAKVRYKDLKPEDISVEPFAQIGSNMQVCIAVRQTGFARVDIVVEPLTLEEVLAPYGHTLQEFDTDAEFEAAIIANKDPKVVLKNKSNNKYCAFAFNWTPATSKPLYQVMFDGVIFNNVEFTQPDPLTPTRVEAVITDPCIGTATVIVMLTEVV